MRRRCALSKGLIAKCVARNVVADPRLVPDGDGCLARPEDRLLHLGFATNFQTAVMHMPQESSSGCELRWA